MNGSTANSVKVWSASEGRHETLLEFEDTGDGLVLVTLEATIGGTHDQGIAFWLSYEQSQDLAAWLLKREAP